MNLDSIDRRVNELETLISIGEIKATGPLSQSQRVEIDKDIAWNVASLRLLEVIRRQYRGR